MRTPVVLDEGRRGEQESRTRDTKVAPRDPRDECAGKHHNGSYAEANEAPGEERLIPHRETENEGARAQIQRVVRIVKSPEQEQAR